MANRAFDITFKIGARIASSFGSGLDRVSDRLHDIQQQTERVNKKFAGVKDAAKIGFGGAVAVMAAAGAAMSKSMEFNDDLQLMALTANMGAKEMQSFKQATLDAATSAGIMAEQVLAGGASLIAAGMDAKTAEKMLVTMSRVVVANKANFEDISAATFSMNQQFGIAAEQMENAFNILSQGGKEGQFELKAMAQYLPSIGARFKTLRIEGMEAASSFAAGMQIMRKNAPSDGEAATMMENMLSYAVSPKGLKYAAKAGSNMKKVIENAWAKGENPMEAYVKEMIRISDGGDAFKLGELVRNDEARQGLQAMIQNYKEYERIKKVSAGAENSGVIGNDYNIMGGTAKGTWDTLKANAGAAAIIIGTSLEPTFKELAKTVMEVATKFQAWAKENPELLAQIAKFVVYGAMVIGAVSALALAVFSLVGPFIALKAGIGMAVGGFKTLLNTIKYLSTALPYLMQIIKWMASGLWLRAVALIKGVGTAIVWLGRVIKANPIILVITAIIAIIWLLYKNWDTVVKYVGIAWNSIKAFFSSGIANIAATIINWSPVGLFYRAFAAVMSFFGVEMPSKFTDFGKNLIQGLINGISSMASAVVDKAKAIASAVTNTVKNAFGINSPSKVFAEFGMWNMQGLANGMTNNTGMVDKASSLAVSSAMPTGSSLTSNNVTNSTPITIYQTINGNSDVAEQAKSATQSAWDEIQSVNRKNKRTSFA